MIALGRVDHRDSKEYRAGHEEYCVRARMHLTDFDVVSLTDFHCIQSRPKTLLARFVAVLEVYVNPTDSAPVRFSQSNESPAKLYSALSSL